MKEKNWDHHEVYPNSYHIKAKTWIGNCGCITSDNNCSIKNVRAYQVRQWSGSSIFFLSGSSKYLSNSKGCYIFSDCLTRLVLTTIQHYLTLLLGR